MRNNKSNDNKNMVLDTAAIIIGSITLIIAIFFVFGWVYIRSYFSVFGVSVNLNIVEDYCIYGLRLIIFSSSYYGIVYIIVLLGLLIFGYFYHQHHVDQKKVPKWVYYIFFHKSYLKSICFTLIILILIMNCVHYKARIKGLDLGMEAVKPNTHLPKIYFVLKEKYMNQYNNDELDKFKNGHYNCLWYNNEYVIAFQPITTGKQYPDVYPKVVFINKDIISYITFEKK